MVITTTDVKIDRGDTEYSAIDVGKIVVVVVVVELLVGFVAFDKVIEAARKMTPHKVVRIFLDQYKEKVAKHPTIPVATTFYDHDRLI